MPLKSLMLAIVLLCSLPAGASAWTGEVISGPGRGFSGDGGRFKEARIWGPTTIAPDGQGGFYFTDSWNNRIRYVNPEGKVETVAGRQRWKSCGENRPARKTCLSLPHGVSLDSDGGLLITDTFHHRLLKIGDDGVARTIAGNGRSCRQGGKCQEEGDALKTALHLPVLARRIGKAIYISDTAHRVLKLEQGKLTRVAGTGSWGHSGNGGPARKAKLFEPADMLPYNGGLLISDGSNCRLRWVSPQGIIYPFAGSGSLRGCWRSYGLVPNQQLFRGWGKPQGEVGDGGDPLQAKLSVTGFMASDGESIWFTDFLNNRVRQIKDGKITTIAGTGEEKGVNGRGPMPALSMRLGWPSALSLTEAGELLLGDSGNDRIIRLSR